MTAENKHCPDCGRTIESDATDGVCPVCALRGALALSDASAEAAVAEPAGSRLGPYELLAKIGEGGWGVVYRAAQTEPIRRQVALKVIKQGMDTKEVIARFEAERQALALMDHPHIAKVLDAGATDGGRPYFVMELVEGIRITDFCNHYGLSTRERLDLFLKVCHAVQHAHQKGIIHRDIKPSNILVARQEGIAVPKVIDFGIAKATGRQTLTDKTFFTAFQQFIGTPAYMSPEQAGLNASDLDTRSDIYTLGVLLYELLTGHTPFESHQLLQAGFDELRRVIREQEPPRPSTRLRTLTPAEVTAVARHQGTAAPKLCRLLRGDLDWIVMKCLEKDRVRRYEAVHDLARDVTRHLNHEPVTAAAPSVSYRLHKFIRRHRVGLAMTAALVLLLAGGLVASTWQAVRATKAEREQRAARTQEARARQEADRQTAAALEARKTAEVERDKASAARDEAQKQKEAKDVALRLAQEQQAKAEASETAAQEAHARALDALKQATNAQAAALASSAESRRQREKLEDLMGFLLDDLSDKLRLLGRVDLLARVTERVLDHYRSLPPDDSSDDSLGRRFAAFKNRGLVLAARGDGAGALAAYRTGADLAQQLSARQPTNRTWLGEQALCAQRIGELWESRGNSTKALAQFEQSRQLAQHLSAQAPAESQWRACLVASELKIGDVLRTQTETAQALDAYQRALALARRLAETSPNDDPDGVAWRHVLTVSFSKTGAAFLEEGRPDDAREACQKSLNLARQLVAERPGTPQWQTDLAAALDSLGDVLLATHDIRPARQHYEESAHLRMRLALTDPANSQWQRDLMLSYARLGRVLSQQSKQPKVAEFIGDSHRATMSFVQQPLQLTRRLFASDQRSQAALAEIERSVETARQLAKRDPDNAQWQENLASSCSLLGDLCFQIGNHPKALQNYQEAIAIRQRLVEHDPFAVSLQHRLAAAHASATAALWRLAQRPAALVQARSALDSLAALASRWPGNLALREGVPPEAGPRGSRWLTADQLNAVREAIVWGFASAREQAAHQAADPAGLEEWARYCQEMAVCRLLLGEPAASVAHAQNAVSAWQRLNLITPTNTLTASALGPAWISLSAYQLLNGQAHAAAQSATRAFEIQPLDIAAKAMLAIACFCDSRYEEGSRILRDNKDHPARHSQTFAQAVREDLRQLQAKRFRQLDLEQIKRVVDTNAPQPTDR